MKKCPLYHAPCCQNECQFYDETKSCCSLVLSQQENYKNMKKQNIVLKAVAVALVGVLAVGAVANFVKVQDEDKTPTVANGYVATSDYAVALVDNYFENIQKTQYSGTTVSEVTVYAKTDGDLEIGTAKIGVAGEAETQVYAVEAGTNVITLDEPLTVGMDETIIIGGGKTNVDLRTTSSTKSSCGDIATLTDGVLSTDFTVSEERLNISMDVSFIESGVNVPISNTEVADCGDISSLGTVNFASAPFGYRDLTLYENSTITKVGVPVLSVSDYTSENLFTLYVVSYDEPLTTFTQVLEYKLKIPANTFSSNTVNAWHYFDVNITVGDNQTLAFGSTVDTVTWGYGANRNDSQRIFYTKTLGSSYTLANEANCLYFDVYKDFELRYTLTEYVEILSLANTKAVLEGKTLSVMGDSISTFTGWSNNATGTNSTIGSNRPYYTGTNIISSVNDTWWKKTVDFLQMRLLVNNSWSGSYVSDNNKNDKPACLDRAYNLHDNTGDNAGETPDIVSVYMGTNDFINNVAIGSFESVSDIYDSASNTYIGNTKEFASAYAIMLHKIKTLYPNAKVFCFTILPNVRNTNYTFLDEINQTIRDLADYFDCELVDLYNNSGITVDNLSSLMGDGLHPNAVGMTLIAECFGRALLEAYKN